MMRASNQRANLNRPPLLAGLMVLLLTTPGIVAVPALAQAEGDDAYGDEYASGDYGRVRYLDGDVAIRRSASDPGAPPAGTSDEITINSPVFPGDSVLTDGRARVEVELAGGSLVRVDIETDLTFLSLPDPYAAVADNSVLQILVGTARISALLAEKEEFRIDTPSSTIYLLGDGEFRIDVDNRGRTRVSSRRGVAEVSGDDSSVLVRAGMSTEVFPDSLPSRPDSFNTFATDPFDRWVQQRESAYRDLYASSSERSREIYEDLPEEVRPHYRELSANGRWVDTPEYGYVWAPEGIVEDWRPYRDGYWSYGPSGYFWVSNEPWGWAPYHYGRWAHVGSRGWCWIPGRVFAGAWVAWSWGSVHVGWSALDYWNRPAYYGTIYHGYYDPHVWSFVHYDHFYRRHYHGHGHGNGHYVHYNRVPDLGNHAVVTRPPRVSPRELANSSDSRNRAMREARGDRTARLRTLDTERRPTSNLRQTERRLVTARNERTADRGTRNGAAVVRPSRPGRDAGTSRGTGVDGIERRGSSMDRSRFPRRTPVGEGSTRRTTAPRSRQGATSDNRTGAVRRTRPEVKPRTEREGSEVRRKDLYQRMADPRTTRERSTTGRTQDRKATPSRTTPRKSDSSTARPPANRPQPKKKQPEAKAERPPARSGGKVLRQTPTTRQPESRSSSPRREAPSVDRSRAPRRTPPTSSRERTTTPRRSPSVNRSTQPQRSAPSAQRSTPQRRTAPKAQRSTPPKRTAPKAQRSTPPKRTAPKAKRSTPPKRTAPKARSSSGSRGKAPSRSSSRSSGSKSKASGSRGAGRKK